MLGKCFDARLVFFHVLDSRRSLATRYAHELGVTVQMPLPSREEMEPEWEAFLSGLQLEKVNWEKRTGEGQAAGAIVSEAKHMRADYRRHGHSRKKRFITYASGSVTEKVVRIAQCAVLTVRPDAYKLKCHEHPLRAIVGAKELGRELKEIGSAASLLAAAGAKASMATALEASLGAGV